MNKKNYLLLSALISAAIISPGQNSLADKIDLDRTDNNINPSAFNEESTDESLEFVETNNEEDKTSLANDAKKDASDDISYESNEINEDKIGNEDDNSNQDNKEDVKENIDIESDLSKESLIDENKAYLAEDFVIEDGVIYGLSKSGREKLKSNPIINMPKVDEDGKTITKIGSFAFSPEKTNEISRFINKDEKPGDKTYGEDNYGTPIRPLGAIFGENDIKKVIIPEGYVEVGQDAFNENKSLEEVVFPSTLRWIKEYAFAHTSLKNFSLNEGIEKIDDTAFFDANIRGELILPKSLKELGERSFKANRIDKLIFKTDLIKEIKSQSFEDNNLSSIDLPSSIESIGEAAFNANPGSAEYGGFLVINIDKNTKLKDKENYFINPSPSKKVINKDLDYSKWILSDFIIEKGVINGFSKDGELKIVKNKDLVLPSFDKEGNAIVEIGKDAFRNINFRNESLRKYDIEKVTLPTSIVKIGDFAFQSNYIESTNLMDLENLKEIGDGAFMNNKIKELTSPLNLEKIGKAAFHMNEITDLNLVSPNLSYLGQSAFRQNKIKNLIIMSDKLMEISDMAFAQNEIKNLELSSEYMEYLPNLKIIGEQAFRNNKIENLVLPNSVEKISYEAFYNNNIKEVKVNNKLKSIDFNVFSRDGARKNDSKTIIRTQDRKNINKLADGDNFVIDPEIKADNKKDLSDLITKIEKLNKKDLRQSSQKQFEDILENAKLYLEDQNISRAFLYKFINDSKFFLSRIDLDKAIKRGEDIKKLGKGNEKDLKNLKNKIEEAIVAYNNIGLSDYSLKRLETELKNLADIVNKEGAFKDSHMVQGLISNYKAKDELPEYHIGVNLYFDKNGKILYILDMSKTIGEGQKDIYGNDIENVDEDNEGYHALAIKTLSQYEGKNIKDILNLSFERLNIKCGDIEKSHAKGLYMAIKDGCLDANRYLISLKDSSKNLTKDENLKDKGKGNKVEEKNKLTLKDKNKEKQAQKNSDKKLIKEKETKVINDKYKIKNKEIRKDKNAKTGVSGLSSVILLGFSSSLGLIFSKKRKK